MGKNTLLYYKKSRLTTKMDPKDDLFTENDLPWIQNIFLPVLILFKLYTALEPYQDKCFDEVRMER